MRLLIIHGSQRNAFTSNEEMKIKFQSFPLTLKRSLMMKLQKTFISENRSSENFSLETQTAIRRNYVSCSERNSEKFNFADTKPFAYRAFQEDFRFPLITLIGCFYIETEKY